MSRTTTLTKLFDSLTGQWRLDRNLHSTNATEPSGKCEGVASFTPRAPSVVQENGKLDVAAAEFVYHEQGEFQLPNFIRLPFSKTYIWRLNQESQVISVWFAKPGTDLVDYLFHKIDISDFEACDQVESRQGNAVQIHGSGGHLCVDDFYSTSYTFTLDPDSFNIPAWESLHEVRGPKKDQLIFTKFYKT